MVLETISGIEEDLLSGTNINIRKAGDRLLISIEDENFNRYELQIVGLDGRIVLESELSSGVGIVYRPVDISNLERGAYFYRILIKNLSLESGKFVAE